MSQYIDLDKAIADFNACHGNTNALLNCYNAEWIVDFLESRPAAADAVKVVRCKDCAFWQDNNGGYPQQECRWGHGETPDPDDYCSYGERISEDHDIKIYDPKTQHINADLADRCNHGTRE